MAQHKTHLAPVIERMGGPWCRSGNASPASCHTPVDWSANYCDVHETISAAAGAADAAALRGALVPLLPNTAAHCPPCDAAGIVSRLCDGRVPARRSLWATVTAAVDLTDDDLEAALAASHRDRAPSDSL